MSSFLDGIKFAFGILFVFGIIGLVYASGWHIPSEILGGTFGANTYVFNGSTVDFTGATVLGVAAESGNDSGPNVVQAVKTDTFTHSTTTWTNITDLNITITPTSADAKIFLSASVSASVDAADNIIAFRIVRDGTVVSQGDTAGSRAQATWSVRNYDIYIDETTTFNIIDEPATTSPVTYSIQTRKTHTYTGDIFINRVGSDSDADWSTRTSSTLLAYEINGGGGTVYDVTNGTYLPAGTVLPFNLTSCPTGWAEYEPAYGRFIRGIDKSGSSIDADGQRALGNIQNDSMQEITGDTASTSYITSRSNPSLGLGNGALSIHSKSGSGWTSGGTGSNRDIRWEFNSSNSPGARTSSETRPKNVALLYCIKTGGSSESTTGGVQSAFSVHRNGVDQSSITTLTDTAIDWTTEEFDTNSEFNLSSDRFVPKVAGKYLLAGGIYYASIESGKGSFAKLLKNGVEITKSTYYTGGATATQSGRFSVIVDAEVGDYFELYTWHQNAGSNTLGGSRNMTYFTGARLDSDSYWNYDNGNISYSAGTVEATIFKTTCPAGFTSIESQGRQLGCMQTAEEGTDTFWNAADDCFVSYAGRLPSVDEWYVAMNNFALTDEIDDFEWTEKIVYTSAYQGLSIGSGSLTALAANSGLTTTRPYRCFIPK